MAERNRLIDAIFERALELEDAERQDYLNDACADAELRAEIDDLLRLSLELDPRLDPSSAPRAAFLKAMAVQRGPGPPAEVGAYRLLREIGRGGMATVYLAERADGEFEQQVALKVVSPGYDNQSIIRRFERERQILASLNHPNIAQLLDGGCTDDGTPYFVMEHVAGEPIDLYCDRCDLALEARLELFGVVAKTVQYAHHNLILHRDLKPSNIVVTDDGHVKLLDFGIAKAIPDGEETAGLDLTRPAERFLTPRWASPEQFAGEQVTTASDIYQLGLLLYRLVTGLSPYPPGATASELERAIRLDDPPRPSVAVLQAGPGNVRPPAGMSTKGLARRLRGDLETIVMVALRKAPERRYATVDQLTGDLARFRSGHALSVRPDAIGYRLRKFVSRNLAATTLVGLVAVLLIGYAITVTLQARRIEREAEKTARVKEFLTELFSQANPQAARGSDFTVADLVSWGAERVRHEFRGEPEIRAEMLSMLGALYVRMGRYDVAESLLSEAMEAVPLGGGPATSQAVQTARGLAETLHYLNRFTDSERLYREILAVDLSGLESPAEVGAALRAELADLLHTRGRYAEAERELLGAIAALRSVAPRSPSLVKALRDLGNVQRDRGDLIAGEVSYHEALQLAEDVHGRIDPQAVIVRTYFSQLLIMKGDHSAAERLLGEARRAADQIYAEEHSAEGMLERTLGVLRLRQGRLEEARRHLETARSMHSRLLGVDQAQTLRARVVLAELTRIENDPAGAHGQASLAFAALVDKDLEHHRDAFAALVVMARCLLDLGRTAEAEPLLRRALAIATEQFVASDPEVAELRQLIAGED